VAARARELTAEIGEYNNALVSARKELDIMVAIRGRAHDELGETLKSIAIDYYNNKCYNKMFFARPKRTTLKFGA
jgi:hypothetical protein